MKKKRCASRFAFILLALGVAMLTGGCSSENQSAAGGLHVAIIATYVSDDWTTTLQTNLQGVASLANADGKLPTVSGVSSGDSAGDPMGVMAAMAKISGMFASGEIELMICDAENAQRYGDGGESYMPLAELYSEAEIAAFHAKSVSLNLLDDEGNATGAFSVPCGLDFSDNEAVQTLTGLKNPQAFIVRGAKNADAAKAALAYLAAM